MKYNALKYKMFSGVSCFQVFVAGLLEAENKASDLVAVQKAREYYKSCMDEGQ